MKKALLYVLILTLALCGCAAVPTAKNSAEVSDYSALSSTVQGWGMRKTDSRSEFTAEQIDLCDTYKCIYMGAEKEKVMYLTFDEGYENGYTSVILDTLREYGVPAAFFVTGAYVRSEPELIARMAREGHTIGNHTVNHPCVAKLGEDELKNELGELDRLVYGICKKKCKYFRPPKGEYSDQSLARIKDMGYTTVFWSFAYVDWDNKVSREEAFNSITKRFFPGSVLLLHAVSKGNAEALGDVIEAAQKEGYVFKSLDEYIAG